MRLVRITVISFGLCVIGLTYAVGLSARVTTAKVELILSFSKEEYKERDPVEITLTLKNRGNDPIYVNSRFFIARKEDVPQGGDVYFEITSPSKESIPPKVDYTAGFPKTAYFKLLKKDEEAVIERPRNIKGYYDFTEAGTYTITAVYHNIYGPEIGLEAFEGPLRSKPKKITILKE